MTKTKMIRNKIAKVLFVLYALLSAATAMGEESISVTLLTDEGVERPLGISTAERNLGVVLSEINRAQAAKTILTTKDCPWTTSR